MVKLIDSEILTLYLKTVKVKLDPPLVNSHRLNHPKLIEAISEPPLSSQVSCSPRGTQVFSREENDEEVDKSASLNTNLTNVSGKTIEPSSDLGLSTLDA